MKSITSILLIILFANLFGQSAMSKLGVDNCNEKLLEHIIKEKIDSVRLSIKLAPLANDSILYISSKYHADWLNENNKFSHNEKTNPPMLTPQLRVNHFGGNKYLVGENIIKTYINIPLETKKGKKYINKTYEDVANDFVIGWVNSPGHYANIATDEYQITGLSISINKDKNLIISVQKFATVPNKYNFVENKDFFNYSNYQPIPPTTSFSNISRERISKKYPWKIKSPKHQKDSLKKCSSCNYAIDNRMYKDYFTQDGKRMRLVSFNTDVLDKVIRKRRDGFALEYITYTPYDCGNSKYYTKPSRRNNQSILSDTVIQPIYKKDLKKGFKKSKYSKYFHIRKKGTSEKFDLRLGKAPKGITGYYEVNLIVLQKKRVCRVIHFSDYCGTALVDYYRPMPPPVNLKFSYSRAPTQGTIVFQIPFERGKYEYDIKDIAPLLGSFSQTKFTVDSIRIDAFSSLEGSEEINKNLQNKRAESIVSAIRREQSQDFKSTVSSEPNWELFETQIEKQSILSSLKSMNRNEIEEKLKDKVYTEKIEHLLSKQRVGNVKMNVHFDIPLKNLADTLTNEFIEIYNNKANTNYSLKYDSLLRIQSKLFQLYDQSYATISHINQLGNIIEGGTSLHEHYIWHLLEIENYDSTTIQKKYALALHRIKSPSWATRYFETVIYLDRVTTGGFYNDEDDLNILSSISYLQSTAQKKDSLQMDSLELYAISTFLNYFGPDSPQNDNDKKVFYCKKLIEKVKQLNYPEIDIYNVAEFMIFMDEDVMAYELLNWELSTKGMSLDCSKTLHAKLGYYHNKEFHNGIYHESLISLFGNVKEKSWCEMFIGPCNISFQAFDYEPLRNFYCEKCGNFPNYAQQPELWEP